MNRQPGRRPQRAGLGALLLSMCVSISALELELPLTIPYAMVRQALADSLFQGPGAELELVRDNRGCNHVRIGAPRLAAGAPGELLLTLDIKVRGGTPLADLCLLPFTWQGRVEVREEVYIGLAPTALAFRVREARLRTAEGGASRVPAALWTTIERQLRPPLERFSFDLGSVLAASFTTVGTVYLRGTAFEMRSDSVALKAVEAGSTELRAMLALRLPDPPPASVASAPSAPLNAREMAAWDARWQAWDGFATWAIKTLAADAPAALRAALRATLLDARHRLASALSSATPAADPVRELFLDTWRRLAPLVARNDFSRDTSKALQVLAFINAGDALQALDTLGGAVGLRLNQDGLRQLARALAPGVLDNELEYSTALDPALRALFGFPPTLELAGGATRPWLDFFVASAHAASDDPLDAWVPDAGDLERYLAAIENLLAGIAEHERKQGQLAAEFFDVYSPLLRATAWQETCWRQFVRRHARLEVLRSAAGSVGIMQVNEHVWRGIYALDRLRQETAYNAQAGNEILVHYLVDYAIRRNEHVKSNDLHALARASYAVYNGGPRHLTRYRRAQTKPALRAIDDAFWHKYQAVRAQGPGAVKACYAGTHVQG